MRLPGTRYQEHGWEQVRKLLGRCSLQAFARLDPQLLTDPAQAGGQLSVYIDLVAAILHEGARAARAEAPANSYGDSVSGLALSLLYELQARAGDWAAFCAAVAAEAARSGAFWTQPGGDASLRKKVNDMYAVLRDKVDSDHYQAACGRVCSPNKMYTYRMLDTAYGEIARLFADWEQHREQVGFILGRSVDAIPIEVRRMTSIAACKPEWVVRWSGSQEHFGAGPGPLHTRSKRFSSLKNSLERIASLMSEIGEYEALSANRDRDWLQDAGDAALWLDDLQRVLDAPAGEGPDQILEAEEEQFEPGPLPDWPDEGQDTALWEQRAASLSLPLRFMELAQQAQEAGSWTVRMLGGESLPVRLAVYLKMLGPGDDCYPDEWRDPATGELPTMAQLAALDDVSLPTLRKRRDAAIARLTAAAGP